MKTNITICGDTAVTVTFGTEICPEIGKSVKNLNTVLLHSQKKGIIETIPTFCSLTVIYEPNILPYKKLVSFLETAIEKSKRIKTAAQKKIIHVIPVCYEGEFAEDLGELAALHHLSEEEVVKIHTSVDYLIYMLGFLPGFAYLGGLDKRIETPRLESPRTKIPAGSVGIGGNQTGIYPLASPGGWRLIGKTPVLPFDKTRKDPIIYKSGEYIRFESISRAQFDRIEEDVKKGEYKHRIIREAG